MNNIDKQNLAEIVRDMADQIVERMHNGDGYMEDISHLSVNDVRNQLDIWMNKLPAPRSESKWTYSNDDKSN